MPLQIGLSEILVILLALIWYHIFGDLIFVAKSYVKRHHTVDGQTAPCFDRLRQVSNRIADCRVVALAEGLSGRLGAIETLRRKCRRGLERYQQENGSETRWFFHSPPRLAAVLQVARDEISQMEKDLYELEKEIINCREQLHARDAQEKSRGG
ncbi:hypothetical protein BJ322DRAFT_1218503 [Thelephora terrestris]|uniref:Uncharacterized protein n=1 Tax=Thelephora terrestris TaxID=56493 RepID=A0A9P6HFN0_9AGAM|nr:hypothetical protein BJ322DRAFT_1218503 [Thelephora terrestris]